MKILKEKNLAIICMLISALSFSIMQFCVKATPNIPIGYKVLFRNIFSMAFAYYVIKKRKLKLFGEKKNQKYLFGRTLGGFLGVILFFIGTMQVNLSDAAILNKLSPFVVIILAYFILHEKITGYHIYALLLALTGSFLVIKPKLDSSIIPVLILALSAILSGIAYVALKLLGDRENTYTIVFHYSFFSVILCLPLILSNFVLLSLKSFFTLLCVGIFAGAGQIALTNAYKCAPASEVSIYDYSNIIFSGALGYIFLQEIPDYLDIVGVILIILSAIIIYQIKPKEKKP